MEEKRDKRGRTEAEAIAAYREKNYPRPAMTADIALFAKEKQNLKILLIRRGNHPYLGCWALPGGFVNENESVLQAAQRELEEETHVKYPALQLVGVYSKPGRDPRGWVVSVAYTACLEKMPAAEADDDAADAKWIDVIEENHQLRLVLPLNGRLAFDHEQIIRAAYRWILFSASAEELVSWCGKKE